MESKEKEGKRRREKTYEEMKRLERDREEARRYR